MILKQKLKTNIFFQEIVNIYFSEEEIVLACKNILYIASLMLSFHCDEKLYNEVYAAFRPFMNNTADFLATIPLYISFLNKFIKITMSLLSEYVNLRDEFFDKKLAILSRRQILNFDEIREEWQEEKKKLIESGEDIRWSLSFQKFFRSIFENHREEIERNKQTEEYKQLANEPIFDMINELNTRLNK